MEKQDNSIRDIVGEKIESMNRESGAGAQQPGAGAKDRIPQQPGSAKNSGRENKKSTHAAGKAAGAALLLALLGGGGYFGLGVGNPDGGFLNPSRPAVTAEAPSQATEAPTEAPVTQEPTEATTAPEATTTADETLLMIRVRENGIEYQGQPVTLAELEQALLSDYKEGKTVRLVDDHAIKAAYDEVQALLDQLKLPVETESD